MRLASRIGVVLTCGALLSAVGAKVHADAHDLLLQAKADSPVAFDGLPDGALGTTVVGGAGEGATPKPAAHGAKGVPTGGRKPATRSTTSSRTATTTKGSGAQTSSAGKGTPGRGATADQQTSTAAYVDLRPWATAMSPKVDIPALALAAYGAAELRLAREDPACHLSWVALAGIGSVESDHGRFGGAVINADGTSTPPVIGVPLDGNGVGHVSDSDGGAWDGDPAYDRAVGPMQFLPGTWRRWGADADGDGTANPFSLPDAALAAGRYLCAVGGDLRQPGPWRSALWSYNRSDAYAANVTGRSHAYAAASLQP